MHRKSWNRINVSIKDEYDRHNNNNKNSSSSTKTDDDDEVEDIPQK